MQRCRLRADKVKRAGKIQIQKKGAKNDANESQSQHILPLW